METELQVSLRYSYSSDFKALCDGWTSQGVQHGLLTPQAPLIPITLYLPTWLENQLLKRYYFSDDPRLKSFFKK